MRLIDFFHCQTSCFAQQQNNTDGDNQAPYLKNGPYWNASVKPQQHVKYWPAKHPILRLKPNQNDNDGYSQY